MRKTQVFDNRFALIWQVGAKSLETGVYGAYCNVIINLKDIKDQHYLTQVLSTQDCLSIYLANICS